MASERVTLAELRADPARAATLTAPEAAAVLTELAAIQNEMAAIQNALAARLATPLPTEPPEPGPREHDVEWITPDDAAALAGVNRRIVYGWSRRIDWRPFTRRLSRRVLRIERSGLLRWLESGHESSGSTSVPYGILSLGTRNRRATCQGLKQRSSAADGRRGKTGRSGSSSESQAS